MKLITKKILLGGLNPADWLRRAGYSLAPDRRAETLSFTRRLGGGLYPRFHLYFLEEGDKIVFNLHLDQKKASYEGFSRHNAEYEGELLEEEIRYLKSRLEADLFA